MDLNELKQEAEEWVINNTEIYDDKFGIECEKEPQAEEAYLASAEPREKQIQIDAEQIRALQKQNGELTDKVKELEKELADAKKVQIVEHFEAYGQCRDSRRIAELEAQIEKMKSQYDYAFNQFCESREIICSMLSRYRDKKEIDYSIRERGEKLLKQGVYKNDKGRT